MKVTVLIRPKHGILDPQGEAVRGSLTQLGFGVSDVRVGRLVELELEVVSEAEAREHAARMCESLLANPLMEAYEVLVEAGRAVSAGAIKSVRPASVRCPGKNALLPK